jgi:hypothetical protein
MVIAIALFGEEPIRVNEKNNQVNLSIPNVARIATYDFFPPSDAPLLNLG